MKYTFECVSKTETMHPVPELKTELRQVPNQRVIDFEDPVTKKVTKTIENYTEEVKYQGWEYNKKAVTIVGLKMANSLDPDDGTDGYKQLQDSPHGELSLHVLDGSVYEIGKTYTVEITPV